MAVQVNPPPFLAIPKAFLADKEVREFIKQQNVIIFQLWNRTGGSTDVIEDGQQAITSTSSRVSRNAARIYSLETEGPDADVNAQKITKNSARIGGLESRLHEEKELLTVADITSGNQIWSCNNVAAAILTLNPTPIDSEDLHVTRKGAFVKISGNINGGTSITLLSKNDSAHLRYSNFTAEWSIL